MTPLYQILHVSFVFQALSIEKVIQRPIALNDGHPSFHVPRQWGKYPLTSCTFLHSRSKKKALPLRSVEIRECKIGIIFDPLSSFHGSDENDNTRMRRVLDIISNYICRDDVTPLIIHHEGKRSTEGGSYASRGASAVSDWAGAHLSLTWATGNGSRGIRAEWVKTRDFPSPGSIMLRRGQDGAFEKIQDRVSRAAPTQEIIRILREMGGRSDSKMALVRKVMAELHVSRGTGVRAIDKALSHRAQLWP